MSPKARACLVASPCEVSLRSVSCDCADTPEAAHAATDAEFVALSPIHRLKYRWVCAVLRRLVQREGLSPESCAVFIDWACLSPEAWGLEQVDAQVAADHVARGSVARLARATYVIVFSTGEDGRSDGSWERGWIRFERFVPSALAAGGIYTAVYETTLSDLNSLAGMQLWPLEMQARPKASVFV